MSEKLGGSDFVVGDIVCTTRAIRAGLKEDGPLVCEGAVRGVVRDIQRREADGILVVLTDGTEWWMMPTQISLIDRPPKRPHEEGK